MSSKVINQFNFRKTATEESLDTGSFFPFTGKIFDGWKYLKLRIDWKNKKEGQKH